MIGGFSALYVKSNGLIPVKPPKSVQFGNFFCEILLDEITGGRAPNLNGRILIRNYGNEIRCSCLRVQLDATINLKFDTKIDNHINSHSKSESVLQGSSESIIGNYIESPVQAQITKFKLTDNSTDSNETKYIPVTHLQPGSYSAEFNLKWPEEPLPASFNTQFGNLHYKVAAYMKYTFNYIQVAEKDLKFNGHNDLSKIPNYLEPLKNEAGLAYKQQLLKHPR